MSQDGERARSTAALAREDVVQRLLRGVLPAPGGHADGMLVADAIIAAVVLNVTACISFDGGYVIALRWITVDLRERTLTFRDTRDSWVLGETVTAKIAREAFLMCERFGATPPARRLRRGSCSDRACALT